MRSRPTQWLWVLILASLLAGAAGTAASPAGDPPLNEEDLLILEVLLDRYCVSQGLPGYSLPDGRVLLPLGAICDALELALDVDPEAGRARGWFIREDRTFSLDLETRSVTIDGRSSGFDPLLVRSDDADIYVESDLLSRWLPLDFDVRLETMLVRIAARETVPLQNRLKRDEARAQALQRQKTGGLDFPLREAGYRRLSWPLIDASADYLTREDMPDPLVSIQTAGDLAGLSTRSFLTHSRGRAISTARLRAGRESASGALFGPLGATKYEFGDIYAPSIPLVLRGKQGRGLYLTNQPLVRPQEFDATTVEGDAPPGWEIELYVNGGLYEYASIGADGHYRFEDVPLRFGQNVFRKVLYGPQGQVREETDQVAIGTDMVKEGRLQYRLLSLQDERPIFLDDPEVRYPTEDFGAWNHHAEVGVGLMRNLSLSTSLSRLSVRGVRRDYGEVTARSSFSGLYTQFMGASDLEGGTALRLSAQGRLGNSSLLFEQSLFDAFRSDYNEPGQNMTSETRLRWSGAASRLFGRSVSYDLKLETSAFEDRGIDRQDLMAARLATNFSRFSLSNMLQYRNTAAPDGGTDQVYGEQLVSSWWGPITLRGRARYRIDPGMELQSLGGTLSWRPSTRLNARLQLQKDITGAGSTNLNANLSWLLDSMAVGLMLNHATAGEDYLGFSISTSLAHEPNSGKWFMQRQRLATGCAASPFVFLDANANGVFDHDDEPIAGVRFLGSSFWQGIETNEHGSAFLPGLPANLPKNVKIDLESLGDPFLLPTEPGLSAMGHAGSIVELEFPITYSGEIEGSVLAETAAGRRPARNIALTLVDRFGRNVQTTVSEFDGYFLFQEIRPGWYAIEVQPRSLERQRLAAPARQEAMVPAGGGVSAGHEIVLRRAGTRAADAEPLIDVESDRTMEPAATTVAPVLRSDEDIFADKQLDLVEKVLLIEERDRAAEEAREVPSAAPEEPDHSVTPAPAPARAATPTVGAGLGRQYFYGLLERPGPAVAAPADSAPPGPDPRVLNRENAGGPTDDEVRDFVRVFKTVRYLLPWLGR